MDWSAASKATSATKRSDSIWVGVATRHSAIETHFRTRQPAEAHIRALINESLRQGRRALIGFDFAFGYPSGFAARLTGAPQASAVWRWLADRIVDRPDNHNNRFAVAGQINALLGGPGPFWSHPAQHSYPNLPYRKTGIDFARLQVGEFRQAEQHAKGAKSPWMLYNPGAVGSQSLLGLPMIYRLSHIAGVHVWPFCSPDAPVVLAEVYPSLISCAVEAEVAICTIERDRAQVRLLARSLYRLSAHGQLGTLFDAPSGVAVTEEGWILGAGHQDLLAGALA